MIDQSVKIFNSSWDGKDKHCDQYEPRLQHSWKSTILKRRKSAPEFQKSPVPVVYKRLQLDWDQVPTLLGHGTGPGKPACDSEPQNLHEQFRFVLSIKIV